MWINSFQMAPGMSGGLWVSPVRGRSPSLEILRSGQGTILSNVLCRALLEQRVWSGEPPVVLPALPILWNFSLIVTSRRELR